MPEQLMQFKDFVEIYNAALKLAGIIQHPSFLNRKLKVLDTDGTLLEKLQDLEGFGKLSSEDFSELFEYVSLERYLQENLLPEGVQKDVPDFLSWLVLKDRKFDYIFSLNHRPDTRQFKPRSNNSLYKHPLTSKTLFNDNPAYGGLQEFKDFINSKMQAIELFSAALLLEEKGMYIVGGIITPDDINALNQFKKEHYLYLQNREARHLDLSLDTAVELAKLHIVNGSDIKPKHLKKAYSQNFQVGSYQKTETIYPNQEDSIKRLISDLLMQYRNSSESLLKQGVKL